MTELGHGECEIDLGSVEASRDAFDTAYSKITGRSNEYNLITEPVGSEFSDLIGEGIRDAAVENSSAWRGSMNACILAFGVLEQIHSAVDGYNSQYEDIKERYDAYVKSVEDSLPPNFGEIVESYHQEARDAWDEMEKECDDAEGKLKGGATPENIRELAEAGHFGAVGQIGYYVNEDLNYYNVDGTDAETLAVHLEDAVIHGRDGSIEILEDADISLALLNNIAARAGAAERNGDKLSKGEMEFLETLYEGFDEFEDTEGLLDFVGQVQESEHIDDSLRHSIQESLGNGTLALSNENVGGGVEYLPPDVQDAATGPQVPNGAPGDYSESYYYNEWIPEFENLSSILGAAGNQMKGGTEFSAQLLATSSEEITNIESDGLLEGNRTSDSTFQNVIDVASRNEEASYIMITGENFSGEEYQHHENYENVTPKSFFKNLYGYDWDDDGAAVAGVTDWISDEAWHDPARGEVPEHLDLREEAANAAMELVSVLGSEDVYRELSGVGDADVTDDDFDPDDLELAFTAINPEIASSMAGVYESYIDGFAGEQGMSTGEMVLDSKSGGDPNAGGFTATPGDRLTFMEYLIGDDGSAQRAVIATEIYQETQIDNWLTGEIGEDPQKAATLQNFLDRAFYNEQISREANISEAVERKEEIYGRVASMGSAAVGEVPYLGTALSEGLDYASEEYINDIFDEFSVNPSGGINTYESEIENKAGTRALELHLKENRDEFDPERIEQLLNDGYLSYEEGELSVVPPESWPEGSSSNSRNTGLEVALSELDPFRGDEEDGASFETSWDMVSGERGFSGKFESIYRDLNEDHNKHGHPHLNAGEIN